MLVAFVGATSRLRSDMRRSDPTLAARSPRQSAVTVLEAKIESRSVFTNQWRRRKWVVSSKREDCRQRAFRVAPVRRQPPRNQTALTAVTNTGPARPTD